MNIKFNREKMKKCLEHPVSVYKNWYKSDLIKFFSKPEIRELIQNNDFEKLYEIRNNSLIARTPVLTALLLVSDIDFLSHMTEIPSFSFHGLPITEIIIPNNIKKIGEDAFHECESLTNITIPDSVTSIGDSAFSFCKSLNNITIPNSVTNIGEEAFYNCRNLTSITIPNSVKSIGRSTFEYCTKLTSITIPNSVKSIDNWAFSDCENLTNISIPSSIISIGGYAFYKCTNLKNIIFNGTKEQWDNIEKGEEAISKDVKIIFKK